MARDVNGFSDGGSGVRRIAGAPGASSLEGPRVIVVEAVCGRHKKPFAIFFERSASGVWQALGSVRVDPVVEVTRSGEMAAAPGERYARVQVDGPTVIGSEYAGCARCHDRGFFRCGKCRAYSCRSSWSRHGDHKDALCGKCNWWQCLGARVAGPIRNLEGYAASARIADLGVEMQPEIDRPRQASLPPPGMRLLSGR